MRSKSLLKVTLKAILELLTKYLLELYIKEYLFGNTEAKASLLNILRQFDKIRKIDIAVVTAAFVEIPLE